MADAHAAGASSVAARLLAFYREPVLHRPLYLHGQQPLPEGNVVFRLALGRFPHGWLRDLPAHDRDEVRTAARAFVRQVCLWERATHYQVLCLEHAAPREAVRENYHLLIALIHPDRQETASEDWPRGCAQRVNRAYEALAEARGRAAYDAELGKVDEGAAFEPMAHAPHPGARSHPRIRPASGGSAIARRVAVVTGVLAALFIVQTWWVGDISPQYSLLERSFPASARWMSEVLPDAPRFLAATTAAVFDPGERLQPLKEPRRIASLGSWIPYAEPQRPSDPAQAPAASPGGASAELAPGLALAVTPPLEPAPRAMVAAREAPAAPVRPAASATAEPAVRLTQAPAQPPPKASADGPSRDQVEGLVALLVGYYDSGDAENLVALFDPDQLGWWRGSRMRASYADFFAATRERRLRMDRLTWRNEGSLAQARGEATVVADYRDERSRLERRIPVELDIALRGGQPRITRLVLFPGTQ